MREVDVAVVGGGPAGSSAGRTAAERGADALVLEKGVPRADRDTPGPDSTDAAGMLDYWVDLMDLPEPVPEHVKRRELDGAAFYGPAESCTLRSTGMDADYPNFGFTFDRARFDDWLRGLAENAGAEYRVGDAVRTVDLDPRSGHALELASGETVRAEYLVLADGPQRTVTGRVLDRLLPDDAVEKLDATRANHIAYQEHRRFPEELFDPSVIEFWWGLIPGHTAYPWVFPNVGGAMGVTSAFHEGGDHVAVRTGSIAGRLAAHGTLPAYNAEWRAAIGDEVLRNVTLAEMARGFGPRDWDRTFATASRLIRGSGWDGWTLGRSVATGWDAFKLAARYRRRKLGLREDYVQITEDDYDYGHGARSGAAPSAI